MVQHAIARPRRRPCVCVCVCVCVLVDTVMYHYTELDDVYVFIMCSLGLVVKRDR